MKKHYHKIFFDTEFTGLHQNTTLISIGLISECGKTFYAELTDFNEMQLDKWIIDNVINRLMFKDKNDFNILSGDEFIIKGCSGMVRDALIEWFKQYRNVEMWSDCLSYDWVLFNNMFGNAFNIPNNIYYIPFDLCTLFKVKNIDPDINREMYAGFENSIEKHNALWDARVIRECYLNCYKT